MSEKVTLNLNESNQCVFIASSNHIQAKNANIIIPFKKSEKDKVDPFHFTIIRKKDIGGIINFYMKVGHNFEIKDKYNTANIAILFAKLNS